MAISVKEISKLRGQTGAGMMDCKKALTECSGDVDKALVWLRKKGLADVKRRAAKVASEGTVGHYIHAGGKIGVLAEINCETDFVAKVDKFQDFARDVAMHVAASNPQWVSREDVPEDVIEREKEIIASSLEGKPPQVVEKIVEGKLNKFFKETCLMDQLFVKDSNLTIADLLGALASEVGEKLVVKRFARFVIGEK